MRGSEVIRGNAMTDSELLANSIEALVQRVAGTSVQQIDGLIPELQTLRALSATSITAVMARTPLRGRSDIPRPAIPMRGPSRKLQPSHFGFNLPERRLGLVDAIGHAAATVGRASLVVAIPSHSHSRNLGGSVPRAEAGLFWR